MNPSMQTAANMFKLGDAFFTGRISTLDDEVLQRRVAGDVNPIIWMAGHLLNSRKYLLELFGGNITLPFESKFSEKYNPSTEYPPMKDIKEIWIDISSKLLAKMEQASDDHYTTIIDWNLPHGDKTVRGAILFYVYHEGWHMGQIAYALKGMGMEGLVPY